MDTLNTLQSVWGKKYGLCNTRHAERTQILTVKIYFMLFYICSCSRHFHVVCMSEWTVRQASLTTQSLPYGAAGPLCSKWLLKKICCHLLCVGCCWFGRMLGYQAKWWCYKRAHTHSSAVRCSLMGYLNRSNYFNYSQSYYNYIAGDDVNW